MQLLTLAVYNKNWAWVTTKLAQLKLNSSWKEGCFFRVISSVAFIEQSLKSMIYIFQKYNSQYRFYLYTKQLFFFFHLLAKQKYNFSNAYL